MFARTHAVINCIYANMFHSLEHFTLRHGFMCTNGVYNPFPISMLFLLLLLPFSLMHMNKVCVFVCTMVFFFSAVLFFVCSFSFGKFNIRHIASMLYQSKFSKKKQPAYSTSTSHRSVRFNRAFGSTLEASLRYGIFDIFTGVKCLYIFTYIYDEYTTTNATLNNEQHKRKRKRKRKKTNSNHKLINAH